MFPRTGSIISAATSSLFFSIVVVSASVLLYGTCSVFFVTSIGIPGESGTPCVVAPEPAFISAASCAPWNPPSIFMILFLPV